MRCSELLRASRWLLRTVPATAHISCEMSDPIRLNIVDDMRRRDDELRRIIAEAEELKREQDEKIGVHGLNLKVTFTPAKARPVLLLTTRCRDFGP